MVSILIAAVAFSPLAAPPTAEEINRKLATGFNLGNTFDLGLRSTKLKDITPVIDLYSAAGMRHVRLPVTWGNDVNGTKLIDPNGKVNQAHPRLKELDQVIDYALKKGMYVIVNTHHEHWLKDKYEDTPRYNEAFTALWTGIANRYKNRPAALIFEVLNEPEGAFGDWTGSTKPTEPKAIALTRRINEIGYRAIRAVSPTRTIMIGMNGQGNHSMFDDVYPSRASLPGGGKDRYLMATLHTYDPWQFCGQDGQNSNWPGDDSIVNTIKTAAAHGQKLGIPINFGEFGVGRRENPASRNTDLVRNYYRLMKRTASAAGISTTPWDDQGWFGLVTKDDAGKYQFLFDIVPNMMRK